LQLPIDVVLYNEGVGLSGVGGVELGIAQLFG
jgi:hypothetical protein